MPFKVHFTKSHHTHLSCVQGSIYAGEVPHNLSTTASALRKLQIHAFKLREHLGETLDKIIFDMI